MPRRRRKLFPAVAALSLVLALLIAALWVRSYWRRDALARLGTPGAAIESAHGQLRLWTCREFPVALPLTWHTGNAAGSYRGDGPGYAYDGASSWPERGWIVTWHSGVVRFRVPDRRGVVAQARYFDVVVPHWLAFLLAASLPALWVARRQLAARQLRRVGLCVACGYDLRATPEQCPECGAVPAPNGGAV